MFIIYVSHRPWCDQNGAKRPRNLDKARKCYINTGADIFSVCCSPTVPGIQQVLKQYTKCMHPGLPVRCHPWATWVWGSAKGGRGKWEGEPVGGA